MEEVPKNPNGRPTKYKPEYCQMLIDHMKIGMTYTSFAGHPDVRVNIDTLYEWQKRYPSFSEAKKIGLAANEYHMMDIGHSAMTDAQGFNNTIWIFMMKNMHGWRDKKETTHEAGKSITLNYSLDGKGTS